MSEIGLRVDGREYRGWKTARVTRGIEQLAGTFDLSVSERWGGQDQPWPIGEGSECAVTIDGATVITGYVDTRRPTLSGGVSISGRDRAGDLVDCSALLDAWSFSGVGVLDLARKICAPFGVPVSVQKGLNLGAVTLPKKYAIDPGDTAANALENLCRVAGVLATSDGAGGVVLTRAGTERVNTEIRQGVNLKDGSATYSAAGRFREYRVMGSHKGRNDLTGRTAAGVRGSASDLNARPGRVLVIRPEGNVTAAQARERAEWEATVRAARADAVTLVVAGWKHTAGLWAPNQLVRVVSPRLGINGDLLISRVTLALDPGGSSTELEVRSPDAFTPDPTIARAGGVNNYWKEIVRGV